MMSSPLKDILTIVIPSKNESRNIYDCVHHISKQKNITGTNVIIADVSDEKESINWIRRTCIDFNYTLKIKVIKGGYPAEGRLNGSKLAFTKNLLFIDADVFLTNKHIISEAIAYDKDLVTIPFETDKPYNFVFRMFDMFQYIGTKLGSPFAIGGFQLWNTDAYWAVGGYNPEERFAEDYSISQKVMSKNFKVVDVGGAYTSSRRFKNKGVLWMFKLMIKSYFNRNNPEFFKHHHNYWA